MNKFLKVTVLVLILYLGLSIYFLFFSDFIKDKEGIWGAIGTVLTVIGALIGVYINNEASKKLAHYQRLQDKGEELIKLIQLNSNLIDFHKTLISNEKFNSIKSINNNLATIGTIIDLYFSELIEEVNKINKYTIKLFELESINGEEYYNLHIQKIILYIEKEIEKSKP